MTDKDIETALAIHNAINDRNYIEMCLNCPYFNHYTDCTDKLIQDCADYIKRLKASNKRLKTKNEKETRSNTEHV